jgi:tetratricopeptide (TPR) repeat protein
MFECDACGLIFGGSDSCPACGSMISHDAAEVTNEGQIQPKGPLPGLDMLRDSMDGLSGLEGASDPQTSSSSLPFDIGGSAGGATSLPFGVGSPSRGEVEASVTDGTQNDQPVTQATQVEPEKPTAHVEEPEPTEPTESIEQSPVEASPDPTSPEPVSPEPASPKSDTEVVLVARIISDVEQPAVATVQIQPSQSQAAPTSQVQATQTDAPTPSQPQATQSDTAPAEQAQHTQTDAAPTAQAQAGDQDSQQFHGDTAAEAGAADSWEQTVSNVDQDVMLYEEDIVYHDFGDELNVSEVIVDFDSLVDPAEVSSSFDPSAIEGGEPELLPARALALSGLTDEKQKELAHVGFAAFAQSEWQKAADCFRQICTTRPTDSAALNNFGLALLQQALLTHEERPSAHPAEEPHFEAAVLALRQAAKANPEDVSILCNLATSLTSCYRHEAAIQVYDAALNYDPNDLHSMNGKAVSLIGVRRFDDAISTLREAIELAPDDAIIYGNLQRVSPMG